MSQAGFDPVEKAILAKLYYSNMIGGKHTAIENVKKGFPSHVQGEVAKKVNKLIRAGYIIPKNTGYGLHVSLNPNFIRLIRDAIAES